MEQGMKHSNQQGCEQQIIMGCQKLKAIGDKHDVMNG